MEDEDEEAAFHDSRHQRRHHRRRPCSLAQLESALHPSLAIGIQSHKKSTWPLRVASSEEEGEEGGGAVVVEEGRGFVATETVSPGQVVLHAAPYAWVASDEWLRHTCAACARFFFQPVQRRVRAWWSSCERCHAAFYCSERCYARAYYGHQCVCSYFCQAKKTIPKKKCREFGDAYRSLVRLMILILVRAQVEREHSVALAAALFGPLRVTFTGFDLPDLPDDDDDDDDDDDGYDSYNDYDDYIEGLGGKGGGGGEKKASIAIATGTEEAVAAAPSIQPETEENVKEGPYLSDVPTFADVMALVTNRDRLDASKLAMYSDIYRTLAMFLPPSVLLDESTVIDILCAEECNAFGYWDDVGTMYGYGLIPHASFFNHSCQPGVCKFGLGPEIVFRSLRTIQPGEEVYLSYTWITDPKETRQQDLAKYLFECRCPRCSLGNNAVDRFPIESTHASCGGLICPPHPQATMPMGTDATPTEPFCAQCFRAVHYTDRHHGWKSTGRQRKSHNNNYH